MRKVCIALFVFLTILYSMSLPVEAEEITYQVSDNNVILNEKVGSCEPTFCM